MTLYEISNTYKEFLEMVDSGEIPIEAVADTLEGIQGEFKEKADNVACMVKNLQAEAEAIKAEQDALYDRYKSKVSKADSLKNYLSQAMQTLGILKLETPRNALSFRKSTALVIEDEETFKERYADYCKKEVKITIPRSEITKLIKSGQELEGAELRIKQNLQVN